MSEALVEHAQDDIHRHQRAEDEQRLPAAGFVEVAGASALLRSFVALPLVTFKIMAAIHWEALRLWLKGARLQPRPHAAAAKADNTSLASGKNRAYIT